MAGSELIVDDEYCKNMGEYFVRQGEMLDKYIAEYVSILKNVETSAITDGKAHNALSAYINQAEKLKNQIGTISKSAKECVENFVKDIDAADRLTF